MRPIDLNDEAMLGTVEVDDVGRNWMLSPKPQTAYLSPAQMLPEAHLLRGHTLAQFAGSA
jgi:hypothetical protein